VSDTSKSRRIPPPRIVLVDDNARVRETLKRLLEELDWGDGRAMVLATASAAEFKVACSAHDPDIVFVDLRLTPSFDSSKEGQELVDWVTDQQTNAGIIVYTDVPEEVDGADTLRRGADDYITKPANREVFIEHVRAVWRRVHRVRSSLDRPSPRGHAFQIGEWRFTPNSRSIEGPEGRAMPLTISEYQVLDHLTKAERNLITPAAFNVFVLERASDTVDRRLDNIIYRLRKKLGGTFPIHNAGSGAYRLLECRLV